MSTEDNTTATDSSGGTTERIGEPTIDGEGIYPYAGLTRFDDEVDVVDLPEEVWEQQSSMRYWAQEQVGANPDPEQLPEMGLNTLIHELPRATPAQPAWIHPRTGDVIKTAKHNAVVDPAQAEQVARGYDTYPEAIADLADEDEGDVTDYVRDNGLSDAKQDLLTTDQQAELEELTIGDDALYRIAGERHTLINPQQPLECLVEELQERDLADKVFGEVEIDRGGGRASLDVYMDGHHVETPVFGDDREPVVVGLQIQWSFFDDWAFRLCGQALDWRCTNHIEHLTNREVVREAGDVEERIQWRDWFAEVLDRLDTKRDQLGRIIQSASEETLDFGDLPADMGNKFEESEAGPWTALYAYLGLPNYLAEAAGKRLRLRAEDAYQPTWWEIHSAATWAVSHEHRGQRATGGRYEKHSRIANDMLFNPAGMEDRVVENYEAARADDDDSTLAEEGGGIAEIRTAFESVKEKKEQYEQWEEDLREMGIQV